MAYTEITQEEFEDILNLKGYKWKQVTDQFAKENIYLIESDGISIKVYSSLVGGISRGVGADAIRTIGWDSVSNLPVSTSEARVYRTEGWRENLIARIEGVKEKMKGVQKCKICGGVMVERVNRATKEKFMGCLNYKNHPKKDGTDNKLGNNFGDKFGNKIGGKIENKIEKPGNDIRSIEDAAKYAIDSMVNTNERNIAVVHKPVEITVPNNPPCIVSHEIKIDNLGNTVMVQEDNRASAAGNVSDANKVLDDFRQKMGSMSDRLKVNFHEVKGDEPLLETKLFKLGMYPFDKFNVIQSRVAQFVEQDSNVVIEAKTSTGKTIMGELFMWKVLKDGKKVIYTSPLKALTREKWDSWTKKFGELGYKIAIVTGDYRLTDKRIKELNESNIILCTSEMLDHRTRNIASEKSEWLMKAGLLIIDEVQMIGMKDRGDKLEAGLMRFAQINPTCRMVLLSGTMPNSGEIASWINILNGKETVLIKSGWRPIKLNMKYEMYNDKQGYYAAKDNLMMKVMEEVKKHQNDKILIFVHSKTDGRRVLAMLEEAKYKAEFHNADLEIDDRVSIEESFRNKEGGVRIIIATSTLAYGLNLPARIVIITGIHRGIEEVSELDIIQMAGRSGRMGIDKEGDAIILLPETHFDELKKKIENPGNIISQINDHLIAAFHVIGEIVGKTITTKEDVYKWYSRTLAARQNMKIDKEYVDNLVNYLLKNNAIRDLDGKLVETELGKACTYFYLRPDMLKDLMVNWTKIFEARIEGNDFMLTRALSRLNMYNEVIVSKAEKEYVESYHRASKAMATTFGDSSEGQAKIGMAYLNMVKGVKSVEVKDGKKVPNPLSSIQRGLQQDIERVFQALAYIDAKYSRWGKGSFWNIMGLRLKYGIGPELVGLCQLEGIGGTYAKRLYDAGIRNPIEILSKKREAIMVLGAKYDGIVYKNKDMFSTMGYNVSQITPTVPKEAPKKDIPTKEVLKKGAKEKVDDDDVLKFPP